MNNNTKQLKCLEDILSVLQTYMDQFNVLDAKQQGYLDENESELYFSSINFGKEFGMIWNSIHDEKVSGCLIMKQFIIIMFLAQYRHESIDQGSIYRLTEFSQSLRHCEESLQEIEHYRFFSVVTLKELRTKFSQAFFKFEDMLRQISESDTSQIPVFNVIEENQDIFPSPSQEKMMPGSFRVENKVPRSVPKPMSLPQNDPGFLDQSHKEASTLTLRSQPISFEPYPHDQDDSNQAHAENNVVQGSLSIPDVISNITASVTGIASLVGLSNSPKPETRGLDTAQETNRDSAEPSQTEAPPLPIKPKEVNDTISIDPPVDLSNSDTDKKFTDDELNQGAEALKEMGQTIPVTDVPTGPFEPPSKYTRFSNALNETDTQNNAYSSDSVPSIENSNAEKDINELKSAIDTNIHDFTEHMDDAVKSRPKLIQNEDGSFGYATIIVPGKEISKDMQQGALHLRAVKVRNDLDTPSNNESEYLVIDSNFRSGDGNTTHGNMQAKRTDEIGRLERDIEQQLYILSNSASGDSENSHDPSLTSENAKPHMNPSQLKSHIFRDKSTAEAIERLANSPERVSMSDGQERVLYVRDGFENFVGFGLKCLSKDT